MNPDCLQHLLTNDERAQFNAQGYLVVENALDAAACERVIAVMDRVDARERTEALAGKLLSVTDVMGEDDALVDLIDCPKTFPKVWGILGWNIYLYHSHLDVTPNESARRQDWCVAWHQDSMRVNDEIESDPRPRLSLKIGFYLTDVSEPGRGNTLIVPGSHLPIPTKDWTTPDGRADINGLANAVGSDRLGSAVPMVTDPGDVVICNRQCVHGSFPNASRNLRVTFVFGFHSADF